jgi:putative transposase
MSRLARLAVGGVPHLVEHRTAQRVLFRDEAEAGRLLGLLHDAALGGEVALHGYALLPHGLWLLATPARGTSLGHAMQALGRRYVHWINVRRGEHGGLFAGRYRAAPLEAEPELLAALRYLEWRPVLTGAADAPEAYPWSSAAHHVGLATDPHLRPHPLYWALGNTPFERQAAYRALLQAGMAADEGRRYERALAGGWIVGSTEFERQLAPATVRRLRPARPGRPRRAALVTP